MLKVTWKITKTAPVYRNTSKQYHFYQKEKIIIITFPEHKFQARNLNIINFVSKFENLKQRKSTQINKETKCQDFK